MNLKDNKFCFILCINDEKKLDECINYINRLEIPEGYEIDFLSVEDSRSMAEGYEEARVSTDAKYKIYLHQDTYIVNVNILFDLLRIFKSKKKIGAIGVMGSEDILGNRISKLSEVYGKVISQRWNENSFTDKESYKDSYTNVIDGTYQEVGCLWGCFIATQYDVKWEKLFDGDWKYYAAAFCLAMQREGYKTVVANQDKPWCIHDGNNEGLSFNKEITDILKNKYPDEVDDRVCKRVLICYSEIMYPAMEIALNRQGYCAEAYNERVTFLKKNPEITERLEDWISENDYLCVFSYNFSPNVAEAAYKNGIDYISWAWDSPHESHAFVSAKFDTSKIFTFDKFECERLRKTGIPHVEYLPLVTDVSMASQLLISKEDVEKYSDDISFVGQMYSSAILDLAKESYSEKNREKVNKMISSELCDWRNPDKMFEYLDDELMNEFYLHDEMGNIDYYNKSHFYIMVLRSFANLERIEILNSLAERFKVDIYTKGNTDKLKNVNIHGTVHNLTEAPKIFRLSKINLNITTRNIRSGVPLRVFDIMGAGGFVLTNYQKEIDDLFVEDKEIVCYRTLEELIEKAEFYLKHDLQRKEIALNGYNRVKKDYNYEKAIKQLFQ